jgi:manganese transport protein
LLILTQVILSLQLSFAVFPLVMFTADKAKMGKLVAPRWLIVLAGIIAVVIAALNIKLLFDFVSGS